MTFQASAGDGNLLDAHYDLEDGNIVFHSRGGSKQRGAVNADYGVALRLLLDRIAHSPVDIAGAWVDSSRTQAIPLDQRKILDRDEASNAPSKLFTLMSSRMKSVGRDPAALPAGGNPTKRIRIELAHHLTEQELNEILGGRKTQKDLRSQNRLPAEELEKVEADHVWRAVQKLLAGNTDHGFGPSTDFDLITDDRQRLPPKAVFGVAATEALGFEVRPEHFVGGIGTPCFRILTYAGFDIVRKGEDQEAEPLMPVVDEDAVWREGRIRESRHKKRERGRGLSRAKKAAFKREHGWLFCEQCQIDPVAMYGGPHGEACIEAHHNETAVGEMGKEHDTKLEDLQCLCANCHRVVHRLMRNGVLKSGGGL